jgi:hypothetical protein
MNVEDSACVRKAVRFPESPAWRRGRQSISLTVRFGEDSACDRQSLGKGDGDVSSSADHPRGAVAVFWSGGFEDATVSLRAQGFDRRWAA